MQSIIECGGFQYKVSEGDIIEVPLMKADEGAEVTLDKVLATIDGSASAFGTPTVAGASVKAKVLEHGRSDKVVVMKKHRRKDYKRKNGHRQDYTKLQVTAISS